MGVPSGGRFGEGAWRGRTRSNRYLGVQKQWGFGVHRGAGTMRGAEALGWRFGVHWGGESGGAGSGGPASSAPTSASSTRRAAPPCRKRGGAGPAEVGVVCAGGGVIDGPALWGAWPSVLPRRRAGPLSSPPPVPQFPHFGSHLRVSSAGGALGGPPGAVGAAGRVRPTAGLRGRGPSNPPAAPAEPPRAAGNIPRHPHPPPIAVSDGALGTPTPKVPHVGPPVGSSWDWAPTVHPWYSSRAPPSTGTPMPP